MGSDVSKSEGSRRNISKKYAARLSKLGFRPEEVNHISSLLREQNVVSKSVIRDTWSELLTQNLMNTYGDYLVNHSDKKNGKDTVDLIAFSVFLSNFVKGTAEDRLTLFCEFMRMEEESVQIENFTEYCVELMKSICRTMTTKSVPQYTQWLERGGEISDGAIDRWTTAGLRNVCDPDGTSLISREKLSTWMTLSTDVVGLQCYLFYLLYDMEKLEAHKSGEQEGVQCPLPYLEFGFPQDNWKAIVDIPSVVFINSHLPSENRHQWRLAYSADIHGEGFSTFHSLICHRGPSVLVIEDQSGHVFGGYASTSWHVGPQFFGDQKCFLFSLRPVMNIHPALPHNDHFLYLNANQKTLPNGLGMGGQLEYWGLWIDASFEFGSCSPSCSTYSGYKMLSGSPTFKIKRLEVWCAEGKPKEVEDDADSESESGEEPKAKSILDKDPCGRAIMEMMSKNRAVSDYLDSC